MLWLKELWQQESALFLGKYKPIYSILVSWKIYYLKMLVHMKNLQSKRLHNQETANCNAVAVGSQNKILKCNFRTDFEPHF